MSGYHKRQKLRQAISNKGKEFSQLAVAVAHSPQKKIATLETASATTHKSFQSDVRSEAEIKQDEYFKIKDELTALEVKLQHFDTSEHVISLKDVEAYLKNVGVNMSRKMTQHLIWEIDEKGDEVVDWEEFQLTYFRNINDTTGSEPNTFFNIMEFTIFDGSHHKGKIVEDDCMEILFARYGPANLEKELKFLFGDQLRAAGGDGTLSLANYLETVLVRTGQRAIVF